VRVELVAVRVVVDELGIVWARTGCDWRGRGLTPVTEVSAYGDGRVFGKTPRASEDRWYAVGFAARDGIGEPGLRSFAGGHAGDGAESIDDGANHVRAEEGAEVDAGLVRDRHNVGAQALGRTRMVTFDEHDLRSRGRRIVNCVVRVNEDFGLARGQCYNGLSLRRVGLPLRSETWRGLAPVRGARGA
jgi:hypothetical protein